MESENYVYKKEIDWSTLMEGFTLPLDNQVIFLRNMENFLQRGQSKIIHFFMNGKTYDAKIVNVNNSVEKRKKDEENNSSFHYSVRGVPCVCPRED